MSNEKENPNGIDTIDSEESVSATAPEGEFGELDATAGDFDIPDIAAPELDLPDVADVDLPDLDMPTDAPQFDFSDDELDIPTESGDTADGSDEPDLDEESQSAEPSDLDEDGIAVSKDEDTGLDELDLPTDVLNQIKWAEDPDAYEKAKAEESADEDAAEEDEQENAPLDTDEATAEPADSTEDGGAENTAPQEDSEDSDLPPEPTAPVEKEIPEEDLDEYRAEATAAGDGEMVDLSDFKVEKRSDKEKAAAADKKKKKKPKFDIFSNRNKAKSVNAVIAASDPLLYFYNAALNKKGDILYFNVYQVLQDRFMGKVVPHQYVAIAEGSSRIEELNTICVEEVVKQCNQYPQYLFVVQISARFFTRPNALDKLAKAAQTDNHNLIFAFDAISLQNIGIAAKTGLTMLKNQGILALLDNTELISMSTLTELDYDYIRVDSRYYERGTEKNYAYLQLLIKFAHEIGITTSATFCDTDNISDYMLQNGIDAVQGYAVSKPMRTVPNAVKELTLLDSMVNYVEPEDEYIESGAAQGNGGQAAPVIGAGSGRR